MDGLKFATCHIMPGRQVKTPTHSQQDTETKGKEWHAGGEKCWADIGRGLEMREKRSNRTLRGRAWEA